MMKKPERDKMKKISVYITFTALLIISGCSGIFCYYIWLLFATPHRRRGPRLTEQSTKRGACSPGYRFGNTIPRMVVLTPGQLVPTW